MGFFLTKIKQQIGFKWEIWLEYAKIATTNCYHRVLIYPLKKAFKVISCQELPS